jgi:predicted ATPase
MQSKLADLFIEIINKRKINLIIETHSEYFLNRLKLRLIQTKNNSENIEEIEKITNDKINIYFFQEDKIEK